MDKRRWLWAAVVLPACLAAPAWGNGGPFVIQYPDGDPAAKGVLARIGTDLKPAEETRLRVVKEDLTIQFGADGWFESIPPSPRRIRFEPGAPLVHVWAAYTIENPTDEPVEVEFGFPILRGIYMSPAAMLPRPDAHVRLDEQHVAVKVISNSAIYGIIRRNARETIEQGIAKDARLAQLVAALRPAEDARQTARPAPDPAGARKALAEYLTGTLKWNQRDAALLVEYAGLDFGKNHGRPVDAISSFDFYERDAQLRELTGENLGLLAAIGEQKATQFFAQLASQFDKDAAAGYERIFSAWGGDVRERSIDLTTGKVRPREVTVTPEEANALHSWSGPVADPTIYARVDYLDGREDLTDAQKETCRTVLKNLPVVFTFAPMNLLHYRVTLPAKRTSVLTVSYSQHAFLDTKDPASFQLAYVTHPATLWKDFGPIHLKVIVPEGVAVAASVPLTAGEGQTAEGHRTVRDKDGNNQSETFPLPLAVYQATLSEPEQKRGELLIGIDKAAWERLASPAAQPAAK